MENKEPIKTITVLGRKWWDKVNGNTYHTARIMVNGVTVGKTEFSYGYGDHYVQSAADWLEKNGYIKREREHQALWQYCSDHNIHLEYSSAYYLKREL